MKSKTFPRLLFAILAAAPTVCLARGPVKPLVDAVIRPLMSKDGIAGMAIGLIVDGQSKVFDYGEASLQPRRPVTPDTLFEIGSVTKTFTVTLACYAALRGRLALADQSSRFFPSLRASRFGEVRLLNLATQTPGGLPLQAPPGVRTNAELLRYFSSWRPRYPQGTYRTYSNLGIGFLGLVTARSMHRNFATLMQQRLLTPLGLRDTFLSVPAAKMANYAQGYTRAGKPIRLAPGVLAAEAYGIRSTARDMLRFLAANMGLIGLRGTLERALLATHTAYFKAGVLTQDLIWEQYRYPVALGTLLEGNSAKMLFDAVPATPLIPPEKPRPQVWINKTGSTNGFAAYVAFIPGKRLGIVMLANKDFPIADRVSAAYRILTSLAARPRQR